MSRANVTFGDIAKTFLRVGALAFGGWSTTSLLLEKEFVGKRGLLTPHKLKNAVAYAQILPGATQVAIVANVGYQLRSFVGASLATICYLLPSITLMVMFAALYLHLAHDNVQLTKHISGLIAALCGVILANAYRIGKRHVDGYLWWLLAISAFIARLWLGINTLFILLLLGCIGLLLSWMQAKETDNAK